MYERGRVRRKVESAVAKRPWIGPGDVAHQHPLMGLQRRAGNRAVNALLDAQTKVAVGPPGDRYEREADAVASRVMSALASGEAGDVNGEIGGESSISTRLQRGPGGASGGTLDTEAEAELAHARRSGRALPKGVRGRMEGAFGADFGDVRVHTGREAEALNERLGSEAFTLGTDIFFRSALADSSRGTELLAHELTHVQQQRGPAAGAVGEPAIQRKGGESSGGNRLYVGNLSFSTSKQTLEAAFAKCGEVADVNLVIDRETGHPRGFGFVTMGDGRQAQEAAEALNGVTVDGRRLTVNLAQERTRGRGSGSDGGGGGFRDGRGETGRGRGRSRD